MEIKPTIPISKLDNALYLPHLKTKPEQSKIFISKHLPANKERMLNWHIAENSPKARQRKNVRTYGSSLPYKIFKHNSSSNLDQYIDSRDKNQLQKKILPHSQKKGEKHNTYTILSSKILDK